MIKLKRIFVFSLFFLFIISLINPVSSAICAGDGEIQIHCPAFNEVNNQIENQVELKFPETEQLNIEENNKEFIKQGVFTFLGLLIFIAIVCIVGHKIYKKKQKLGSVYNER